MILEACGEFILPFINANIINKGASTGNIPYIIENGIYMALIAIFMLLTGIFGANFAIKSFTAICDGESAFGELSTQTPQWLYKGHWNMMRVVRRGTELTSEWIRCTVNYNHVLILVR
jgi:hypothetical protein